MFYLYLLNTTFKFRLYLTMSLRYKYMYNTKITTNIAKSNLYIATRIRSCRACIEFVMRVSCQVLECLAQSFLHRFEMTCPHTRERIFNKILRTDVHIYVRVLHYIKPRIYTHKKKHI